MDDENDFVSYEIIENLVLFLLMLIGSNFIIASNGVVAFLSPCLDVEDIDRKGTNAIEGSTFKE